MIAFDNFNIEGDDGLSYSGVRPGMIPKPFRQVNIILKNGKILKPVASPEKNPEDIIGFDCSVKVLAEMSNPGQDNQMYFYRIVTIYKDDSKFSVFFDFNSGEIKGTEWG